MGSVLAGAMILTEGILIGYSLAKSGVVESTYDKIKSKIFKKPQNKQTLL